jgi:chemotaxis protein CheD
MPQHSPGLPAPNIYHDSHFGLDAAKILPGEYYVATRDMILVTVLGSCVAACIRDRQSGIGGMNHFMLPDSSALDASTPVSEAARYGVYAMEMLINQVLKCGGRRTNLEAKTFGGGNVMSGLTQANVGERNGEFVLDYLRLEGIPVVAQDLLDIYPRKVYFFPKSGKVLVRRIRSLHNDTIAQRERDYRTRLRQQPVGGDVELFA